MNDAQSNLEHKIAVNRYATIASLKNTLTKAWQATVEVGALDLEPDFENDSHKKNKEALRSLCKQLNAGPYEGSSSSTMNSNSSSTSSNSEDGSAQKVNWIILGVGVIIGASVGGLPGAILGGIVAAGLVALIANFK